MRESSNPVLRNLVRGNRQQQAGGQQAPGYQQGYPGQAYPGSGYPQGYQGAANFGAGAAGMAQGMQWQQGQQPYVQQPPATGARAITVDDVVTKTAATLGVVILFAIAAYAAIAVTSSDGSYPLAMPLMAIGGIGGFVLVMIASFGRKSDSAPIVLSYAAFEGLFVGSISYVFGNLVVQGVNAGSLIAQAVLGTVGVFVGMLVVYKTGAIRVTPRFTRMMVAAIFGVLALALGNLVISLFTHDGGPLRNGGTLSIVFSLVCIGIAAFSFLIDFDQADQLIRAGAPSKAAWGVALGLTVTLVWLYIEILRLLSYLYDR
ncbi:Bax inhibitor-1/YccA family protein [Tsukamurella soli]|uniref:YccA/Bax inhibitor family protein n=1 Tax=Tsukamurella soli TaxID=644556 RepID=A0ABP8JWK4_9ACTN